MNQPDFDFDFDFDTPVAAEQPERPCVMSAQRAGSIPAPAPSLWREGVTDGQETGPECLLVLPRETTSSGTALPEMWRSAVVWREVPAALYLSWPSSKQLAYCAARDEYSALHADPPMTADWYRQRAQSYREMMNGQ